MHYIGRPQQLQVRSNGPLTGEITILKSDFIPKNLRKRDFCEIFPESKAADYVCFSINLLILL